jgi:hypothetical protein
MLYEYASGRQISSSSSLQDNGQCCSLCAATAHCNWDGCRHSAQQLLQPQTIWLCCCCCCCLQSTLFSSGGSSSMDVSAAAAAVKAWQQNCQVLGQAV